MPQYLPLPDGSFLTLKEGQDPKAAWARAIEKYPEAFGITPPKPEEPTVGGQVKEFAKGVIPGAIGMGQTALTGLAALLPQEQEDAARKILDQGAEALKRPFAAAPGYEETVGRKFGESVGSIGPFLALGPFGMAGRAGMVGLGVGAGAGEARIRAEQEGATPEQRASATALGIIPGAAEVFAPMQILGRLSTPIKAGITDMVKRALLAGGEEAAQEAASQIAQNLIAKGIYKPEQAIIEQVGESAAYGGATGALVQGILDMALGRRAKTVKQPPQQGAQQPAEQVAEQPPVPGQEAATLEQAIAEPTLRGTAAEEEPEKKLTKAEAKKQAAEQKRLAQEQAEFLRQYEEQAAKRQAEAAEYERIKALTPEEYALEQMQGIKAKKVKPTSQEDLNAQLAELGYQTEPTPPAPPVVPGADYAAQQVKLAKDREPVLNNQLLASYLMQDPEQARLLVQNQTPIPGVSQKDSATLLGGLKLQLAALDKKRAADEAARVSTARERAAGLFQREPEDLIGAAREQPAVQAQGVVKSEREALERIGQRPATYLTANRDIEGERELDRRVTELVDALPRTGGQITQGDVYLGLGTRKQDVRDLQAQLAVARMTRNRDLQEQIRRDLEAARQRQISTEGGLGTEGGKTAAEFISRSKAPEFLVAEAEGDKFAAEQRNTLLGLARLLASTTIRTPASKEAAIREAKEKYVAQHAAEIEARRKAFGLPPMADWEIAEARARALEGLNTLTNNWGQFEDPVISVKALQNITREAVYQNIFKAAQRKAQEEAARTEPTPKGTRYTTVGGEEMFIPAETGPRIAAPAELTLKGTPRRAGDTKQDAMNMVEMALTRQTRVSPTEVKRAAVKAGSLGELATLFKKAEVGGTTVDMEPATIQLLEQLRDALPTSTDPEFHALAREQAQRVVEGNLPNPNAVRELGDMMALQEQGKQSATRPGATPEELRRTSAQPQKELFPEAAVQTQRATVANFQRMLDSKNVQGMRDAIEQQRKDNLAALQAVSKALPTIKNRLAKAESKYKLTQKKAEAAGTEATNYKKEFEEDYSAAFGTVGEIKDQIKKVEDHLADIEYMRNILATEPTDMRLLINAPTMLAQEKPLRASLKKLQDQLVYAEALVASINATNEAMQTLAVPAKQRADKLSKQLDEAQKELTNVRTEAARQAAKDKAAKDRAESDAKFKEFEGTVADIKEQARLTAAQSAGQQGLGLSGIRFVRDTASIQEDVANLRRKLGSKKAELEKRLAGKRKNNETATLRAEIDSLEDELSGLYEKAATVKADVLSAASEARERRERDLENQREQRIEATYRAKKKKPAPALPTTTRSSLVKDIRTGKVSQPRKIIRNVEPAEAITDKIIAKRAELAETQRRIDFLKANKKDKVGNRKTELFKSLEEKAETQRKQLARMSGQQAKIVAEEAKVREEQKALQRGKESAEVRRAEETGTEPEFDAKLREASSEFAAPSLNFVKKDVADAVRDGRILDALDGLAASGSTEFVRDLATRLRPLLLRTKLRTQKDFSVNGKAATGAYLPETNEIVIDDDYITQENLLHEFVHAATSRVLNASDADLTAEQRQAKADLQALYEQVKGDKTLTDEYGLTDIEEFASEAMSNEVFQQKLEQIKTEGKSGWQRFKEAVMRFFGIDIRSDAFKDAQALIDQIFTPSRKAAGAAKPALLRKGADAPGFEDALNTAEQLIAKPATVREKIDANLGLSFRTQFLDRLAPLEKIANEMLDPLRGTQMMYYLRMADQKMSFVQQAVARGVPQIVENKRADGQIERLIESKEGPNLAEVVRTLKDAPGMNAEAANQLFTLYLAGKRGDRVGYDKLNFGVPEQQIKANVAKIEANKELRDVFEKAREQYNAYNRDLMRFMEQTGVLSPEEAKRLASTNDYIPYYREENGNAVLVIGGEGTYKVGNLTEQPQLRQLIGGNDKILDFLTSSVQNTSMLLDMGLRNQATKNAMYELASLKLAQFLGADASSPDIVRFKDKGESKFVRVNSNDLGIPADLLVKGMEGIPVNNSALVRTMGGFSTLLRRSITISPLYAMRQLFRDSVAAPLLSGANFTPVMGALKQLGKSDTRETLEARGIVGGQIFTGTNEDLTRILGELQAGKMGLSQFIARAEGIAMEADALTRRAQYDSYIEQGLSQMEATLMSLESMNFNRKGLSPSVRLATQLIPFFNAQIQSLDVLYRALTGKMPMNERLQIQDKLFKRGALLAGTAVAYAMLMQDDDTYKNAQPDEKYGNFFVHVPGISEAIRVPVPFEIGYIFKSIPEAMVNIMANESGAEEAYKAFKNIATQTIPGGSSALMPAAVKPLIENLTNYSFFTGRSLETKAEQMEKAEFRYRDNTSELAKQVGALTGTSPIKIENLIRGYTGGMGLALVQSLNFAMPTEGSPEKAAKRLSDAAVIGPLFQPADAGGQVSAVYDRMNDILETKRTYDKLVKDGRMADARALLQEDMDKIAKAATAGNAQEQLGKVTQAMNAIKASALSPEEKREQLDRLQALRIEIAKAVRGAL